MNLIYRDQNAGVPAPIFLRRVSAGDRLEPNTHHRFDGK
jgi:hypothetical protein